MVRIVALLLGGLAVSCAFDASGIGVTAPDAAGSADGSPDQRRDGDSRRDATADDLRADDRRPPDDGSAEDRAPADAGDAAAPQDRRNEPPADAAAPDADAVLPVCPPTVTLGLAGDIVDTTLIENELSAHNKEDLTLESAGGLRRLILIRFDLAALAGCRVTQASLELFVLEGTTEVASIHRVREAWDAGATWVIAAPSSQTSWSTVGCDDLVPGDCRETPALVEFPPGDAANTMVQVVLPPAKVAEWLDGSFANNGLLISLERGFAHNLAAGSSESPARGPLLHLTLATP